MIATIRGVLQEKNTGLAIIECSGIGYAVNISVRTYEILPDTGKEIFLYTTQIFKEDAADLYGFPEKTEREAFLKLISVSKIGPKTALGIMSAAGLGELKNLIVSGNHKALSKIPGIGPKTAERLVVELKDKFSEISGPGEGISPAAGAGYQIADEAVSALVSLGYHKSKAEKFVKAAVKQSGDSEQKIESLIKSALKYAIS